MLKFPTIDIKGSLIGFESYAVFGFWAKHHLSATHEIVHHIFKDGLICLWVDDIEENLFICSYLHLIISFDEENIPSLCNSPVVMPILLLSNFIYLKFEE